MSCGFILLLSSCSKGNAATTYTDASANPANAIRSEAIVLGNPEASVVLIEYVDMQCPACAQWHLILDRTWRLIENDVLLVLRHYPLTNIHPHAMKAAQYVEAARNVATNDAYYTLYKRIIESQNEWSQKNVPSAAELFKTYIREAGLDPLVVQQEAEKRSVAKKIANDIKLGEQVGIRGTPAILLNNKEIKTPQSPQELYELIQNASNAKR